MIGPSPPLNDTPVPNEELVPLPWLNQENRPRDAVSQPWRVAGFWQEILGLEYRYRPVDYMRCYPLLYLLRWRFYVGASLFTALMITLGIGTIFSRGAGIAAWGFGIALFLMSTVVVYVFTTVATLLLVPLVGVLMTFARRKPIRFTMEITRITEKAVRKRKIRWSNIQGIVAVNGDIHFVSGVLALYDGFSVPRTAFADGAAMQRFHAAAIELWKAKGDPDAVSAEARAEFAPP